MLRAEGFIGSGRTFRRITDDFIHVFNVQGSRYGGQFAINLAVQPLSIPNVLGEVPDVKKITQELCEFRRRLSESGSDQWWVHDNTKESMDAAVKLSAHVFKMVGRPLFAQFEGPESPLLTTSAESFINGQFNFAGFGSTQTRMALALARLRLVRNQPDEARAFARFGLENIGYGLALRQEFERICG